MARRIGSGNSVSAHLDVQDMLSDAYYGGMQNSSWAAMLASLACLALQRSLSPPL